MAMGSHYFKQESDKTIFTLASDEEWVLGEDRDHSWQSRRQDLEVPLVLRMDR